VVTSFTIAKEGSVYIEGSNENGVANASMDSNSVSFVGNVDRVLIRYGILSCNDIGTYTIQINNETREEVFNVGVACTYT